MKNILQIKNLKLSFNTDNGILKALNGINLTIQEGDILGLIGESGSGKTVVALSIMGLISIPPAQINDGQIIFKGKDLLSLKKKEMTNLRGNEISIIFQEPFSSLDPVFRIGDQIAEAIKLHQNVNKFEAREKAIEMLRKINIQDPVRVAESLPYELSGGMQQRAMIAIAMSSPNLSLLIADEPTSSLDVTVQKSILNLIKGLKENKSVNSCLFITHDFNVIAEVCTKVAVIYAGNIVETCPMESIFTNCKHPYTKALLKAVPKVSGNQAELESIKGFFPDLVKPPLGCYFHPRCLDRKYICQKEIPKMIKIDEGHYVACHLFN